MTYGSFASLWPASTHLFSSSLCKVVCCRLVACSCAAEPFTDLNSRHHMVEFPGIEFRRLRLHKPSPAFLLVALSHLALSAESDLDLDTAHSRDGSSRLKSICSERALGEPVHDRQPHERTAASGHEPQGASLEATHPQATHSSAERVRKQACASLTAALQHSEGDARRP